ncbi:MAG TPA: hypothetical protein VJK54_06890 [Chthoniobacterales bacterium]|nr:hypothetical protein [Chthoniobacterales bacterium]
MKQHTLFTFVTLSLLVSVSFLISGCNMIRGFGEDVSGSATFVEKKMTGEDTPPANPPQWPRN